MPRSSTRALVLLATAATLGLTQLTPAHADLSPRCSVSKYMYPGVTLQVCVSADTSYVRGTNNVLVNPEGVEYLGPSHRLVYATWLYYGPTASEGTSFTGPHSCEIDAVVPGTYTCPAFAARNVDGLVYRTVGSASARDDPESYKSASPWVNP